MRPTILIMLLTGCWSGLAGAQAPSPDAERLLRSAQEQGLRITPEQAERLAERQRELVARFGSVTTATGAPPAREVTAPAAGVSEARLGQAAAEARRAARGMNLDGTTSLKLVVDGRRYVDPEGELANVAASADLNAVTFLVGRDRSRVVKFAPLSDLAAAMPVGRLTATGADGPFTFEGATGVRIVGNRFTTLPDGVVLWRDDALFLYRYGDPVVSAALPQGYRPAELQHGDVGGTGVLLVRRDRRGESGNAAAFRAAKGLFAMVGAGKAASDFALFDTRSGTLRPLPIDDTGSDGPVLDRMDMPSMASYFWQAQWMALGRRRFAVHRAGGMRRLLVTDLDSGKTVQAFDRGLGITSWSFTPDGRGSGRLVANWMLQDHAVDDLVGWFDAAPAAPGVD